jgi:hypothetical protein
VGDHPDVSPHLLHLEIYPHPVADFARFSFHAPDDGQFSLALYDLSGTMIGVLDEGLVTRGHHTQTVNFDLVTSGVFLALLQHNGRQVAKPLVILP